jgi:hypothetical protein
MPLGGPGPQIFLLTFLLDYGIIKEKKERNKMYLDGKITKQEWIDYCFKYLENLMEENKEVLIRLKNA